MKKIAGMPGSAGFAVGQIVLYQKAKSGEASAPLSLEEARKSCAKQCEGLYQKALKELGEKEAKIFQAYKMLLEDPHLFLPIQARIDAGEAAEAAVRGECEKLAGQFARMKQEYLRQRADDLRHIGSMVLDAMHGTRAFVLPAEGEKVILAAYELTPADTLLLDKSRLGGFIIEQGGATSHSVILARTMNIPAVTGVKGVLSAFADGQRAILDGTEGIVLLEPDEESVRRYTALQRSSADLDRVIAAFRPEKTATRDGTPVELRANIGRPADMKLLEGAKYGGIGLFRTEFLYSDYAQCPGAEEQEAAYRQVFDAAGSRVVTVRTLDIGGDKSIPYLDLPKEQNPFLGDRGLRLCLERQPLFREQLRSILTAAAGRSVSIMFPMVTELFELREARKAAEAAAAELREAGRPCCDSVRLGIMVETPAAAVMAESFARHCDFMSIGTNDLTQYVTAADRGNPGVHRLYNPFNPAVLRMIAGVARAGSQAGTEVCVCGELGGDPAYIPILLGCGIRVLSVSPALLQRARYTVCNLGLPEAEKLVAGLLQMEDSADIEREAKRFQQEILNTCTG